jgi:hypothetical protein
MTITKECLGLAAEYAVASELCRRGIYAQLTLGNRKRTDLLVDADAGTMFRIQVKSKQGRKWPGVKGVHGESIVLVLVDYEKKEAAERPDFYILRSADWKKVINKLVVAAGHVDSGKATISEEFVVTWRDNYVGLGVRSEDVLKYRESWDNLIELTQMPAGRAVKRARNAGLANTK